VIGGAERRSRKRFVGIDFDACDMQVTLDWIAKAAGEDRFAYVVTPNAQHAAMLDDDRGQSWLESARLAVAEADLCVNDSRVLARLARLFGILLPVVTGSDLTRELITRNLVPDIAIALIGGSAREAEWLRQAMPGRKISHLAPPMGIRDRADLQDAIVDYVVGLGPAIVFLAVGAPQAEIVARRIAQSGKARGVALCIGASIEFLSGAKRRAPRWMQRAGLEWLFRLGSEPGRLWRRYLIESPRIFLLALRERR
jgi:N-acetylglucosaminyldiphosphoundecaprenol N-acetyl-beta-D-mannosaminyltransferase